MIFLSLGLLLYGNSLFNDFVGDDRGQVKDNQVIRSVWNIPSLFTRGTFDNGDLTQTQQQNYYKPLLSSAFAFIYLFSQNHPFGFHLVQLLIHITNSVLIYAVFKRFFEKKASFLLALFFLAHPLNTEAVVYISNLQDPLFVLFGLSALYIKLYRNVNFFNMSLITVLLTASLLSKETGIAFLVVIPVFSYLYNKSGILEALVPSGVAFLTYSFLRFGMAKIYFPQSIIVPIMSLPFMERVVHIPKIVFFYLSTFIFPKDLLIYQTWTISSINFQNFYVPLLIDIVFFSIMIFLGLIIYRTNKSLFKALLLFFVWFSVGLGIHLQLFPLDQTVSDRWFYFPMIGLLGIFGCLFGSFNLTKRFKLNLTMPIILIVLVIFSIRVIIRNTNWRNPLTLYTHDLKYNKDSFLLERELGGEYFSQKKFTEAETHYLRATRLFPSTITFSILGVNYVATERFNEAEEALESALKYDANHVGSWAYLAIAKYKLGDEEGAITAAKKAHSITPSKTTSSILKTIESGKEINILR